MDKLEEKLKQVEDDKWFIDTRDNMKYQLNYGRTTALQESICDYKTAINNASMELLSALYRDELKK